IRSIKDPLTLDQVSHVLQSGESAGGPVGCRVLNGAGIAAGAVATAEDEATIAGASRSGGGLAQRHLGIAIHRRQGGAVGNRVAKHRAADISGQCGLGVLQASDLVGASGGAAELLNASAGEVVDRADQVEALVTAIWTGGDTPGRLNPHVFLSSDCR